jgi:hypothetical protein
MKQPLFLLDIDGVANIFDGWIPSDETEPFISKSGETKYRRRHVAPAHLREAWAAGYSLLLDPRHPEWIAEIEAAGFDSVWATMWQDRAATEFAPVAGFGSSWDHLDFHSFHQVGEWRRTGAGVGSYKWPGITAVLGDDTPGIWVDDDMEPWQHAWAEARTERGIPTLFIQPETHRGMTRDHVNQVLAFARSLAPTLAGATS